MSLSMYQASVPVFIRGLTVLAALLEKGAAHAAASGIDPAELVNARLAPDMYPLSGQVQRASDASKFAVQRLSQVESPKFPDEEATFEQLQKRVADTIAYLQSVPADKLDGAEGRKVTLSFGDFKPEFQGDAYLLTFALPNFYFHVTTAYDILRHAGVAIGKLDFLGPYKA
ncbi:DUF1993 domain-containing protein [Achromobacter sp. NCFB-sbj8-Ac1-l]|uniref:DUF1993 domain-containing protein n=1 Tax=unclassified Achromobacter TaxID=2626865 RepID=UPI004046D618